MPGLLRFQLSRASGPGDLDEGWGGQLVVDRAQPLDGVGGGGRHV